jgi:ferredoxin--NADP+ reductase
LGAWEIGGTEVQLQLPEASRSLIKRLYSISCSMLDDGGRLVRPCEFPYLEFFIAQVHQADSRRQALTPRLFSLTEGARLFCSRETRGRYTLERLSTAATVVLVATGTGEAPHNAMVAELLASGFPGQIISITCVRKKRDLAYATVHRKLERLFLNYRYLTLTTREPENIDSSDPKFVGKRYLQEYFESGDFERDINVKLSVADTHFFLCGNPVMVGTTRKMPNDQSDVTRPDGMIDILERRGFRLDRPHSPGNIHIEKYW